jgi:hypothetical protein
MALWEIAKPILLQLATSLIEVGLNKLGECLEAKTKNSENLDGKSSILFPLFFLFPFLHRILE